MRKRWFWLSLLLVPVMAYLYLAVSSLPGNTPVYSRLAVTSPEINQSVGNDSLESRKPLPPAGNIQPAEPLSSPKGLPLPAAVAGKPLPRVFWGYLRLVDTVFFGHNHPRNKAIIKDLVTSQKAGYPLDSILPYGGRLIRILKDRVVLEKDGHKRSLKLFVSLDSPAGKKALLARGYQQVSQNEWLIRPNRLLGSNKKIESILAEAEISPAGGRGFQLNKLKQGSLIGELGFQAGDTVRAVNGEEIAEMKDVLLAYWQARKSPLITIRVERNQRPINLSYRIVPDGAPAYSVEDVLQTPSFAALFGHEKAVNN